MDANAIMTELYRKQMLDEADHARLVKIATEADCNQPRKRLAMPWASLQQVFAAAVGRRETPRPRTQECWDAI